MNNNEDGAMKVPQAGCDKLTSPEEIAALSKYLRKKRIEHEESINLRDSADRKATSDLRNNISLSGSVEKLNSGNLNALGKETAHKIIGESKGVDSLGNQRVEAEGVQKNQDKLSSNLEKLGSSEEDIQLFKDLLRVGLQNKDNTLREDREKIEGDKQEIFLSDELLSIADKNEPKLTSKVERLSDTDKKISLSNELLSLQTRKSVNSLEGGIEEIVGDAKNDYYELPINPLNVVPGDSPEIKKINVEAADIIPGNIVNNELGMEVSEVIGGDKEVNLGTKSTKIIGDTPKITELDETLLKDITVNEEITLDNNSENIPGEIITVKISDEKSHIMGEGPELMQLGGDTEKVENISNEINSLPDKLPEILNINEIEKLEGQVKKPIGNTPVDRELVDSVEKIIEDVTPKSDEPILNAKAESISGNINNELKLETGVDRIEDDRKFVLENNSETVIGETEKDIRLDSIAEGIEEGDKKNIENLPLNSIHPTGDTTSKVDEISYINPEIVQNQKNIVLDLEKDAEKAIGESPILEGLSSQNDNTIIGYDKDAKPILSETKEVIYSEHGIEDPVLERDRENIILSGDTQPDPKLTETTEKIKNITNTEPELRKDVDTPEGQILESINLPEEKETVSGDFAEFDSLPNKALKKEGEDKVVELSETVIKEVQKFEKESLETNVLDVSGDIPETKELSGHREDLEGTKNPDKLSDTRLDLGNQENPELSDKVIREITPKEVIDLSHERLDLKDIENPELSDTLIKEVSVEDTPLSNKRLDLKGVEDHELSDILVKEVVEKEVDLSNIREDIEIEEVDSLSDVLIKEVTTEEVSLSDTLIKEVTETNPELSDVVIKEVSPVDPSLSDIVIKEASQVEPDLSELLLTLETEDPESLSDILIKASKNDTDKINVGANYKRDDEGSETSDDFSHSGWQESLSVGREKVEGEVEDKDLSDILLTLDYEDETPLSTTQIKTPGNDTSKINVGRNLIPDDPELDEDGNIVGPGGDDYVHTGWNETLDDRKFDVSEQGGKGFTDDSLQDWIESLYEEDDRIQRISNDISKINVGKNLIPDDPELDEDGNYIGPGGDDYQHRDWNEQLDERVLDIKESEVKKITDGKEEEWDEETLYEEAVKRAEKDKSKINVGNNMIAERWHVKLSGGETLEFPAGDDYRYKGWDEKNLDKRLLGIEDDDSEKLDLEGNPHSRFNAEEDGLYEEALKTQDNDTSKVNVGKNLIPDSPELDEDGNESPGGDDYVHTGWNESLDNRKLNAKKSDKDLEFSTGENDTVEADEDNLISQLIEILKSRKDTQLYYTNILKFAQNKNISSGWTAKLSSLMSAYLSGESSEERLKQFEIQLFKTIFTEYKDNLSAPETSDKINVGRNLIPDDPETDEDGNITGPGGYGYVHTGWNESLDNRKLNIRENKNDDVEKLGKETKNINKEGKKETKLKNDSVYVSKYKLNWHWQNVLDVSQYLRYVAEQATFGTHGSARTLLLDTTLMALVASRNVAERLAGANRDRLPGGKLGNIVGATQGNLIENAKAEARRIAKAGIKAMTGGDPNVSIDKTYPLNRPEDRWYRTEAFQPGGNRSSSGGKNKKKFLKSIKNAIAGEVKGFLGVGADRNYHFGQNYLESKAMGLTLKELAGVDPDNIKSVEELRLALNSSEVTTTASKVTTTRFNFNQGVVSTLDDNSNWEIILTPYCGPLNGNCSYLPSIWEICGKLLYRFGVDVHYSWWIPFTSFELSKSRLISKTIQLFDGEISYPTGIEYTNELRISIADDQYKSWRTYFERCVEAAIYNSPKHEASYYDYDSNGAFDLNGPKSCHEPTKIDKTIICPAPYKNVTFRCLIYCMTPQKETIDKYDLLLVMKDFSEERSGDIEPGGGDLNVTFSIVGEHPSNDPKFKQSYFKENKETVDKQADAEKVKNKANLAMSIVQATTLAAANGAIDMI